MEYEELKAAICKAIDAHRDEIIGMGEEILHHPELGFKEERTAKLVADKFSQMGLTYREGLAITGVKGVIPGASDGPAVAILGELDALIVSDFPLADPATGAAHACGHNVQIATMIGAGLGLLHSGVMKELSGRVVLFAVPAEEFVEIDHRMSLKAQDRLEFLGGKAELIRRGEFDDVDMALIAHALSEAPDGRFSVGNTTNGFIGKRIRFLGRAAHAGKSPYEGTNALNAAALAILSINNLRETFRDEDFVRLHGIITKGGDSVNVVPAEVKMEYMVRAKTLEAMRDANEKVNRALHSAAAAVGCQIEVVDLPGYLPLIENPALVQVFKENVTWLVAENKVSGGLHIAVSTDMGDLSHLKPAIHPMAGGFTGTAHTKTLAVADPEVAYITTAKALALTVADLLRNGAAKAKRILSEFVPTMSKEDYLSFMRGSR